MKKRRNYTGWIVALLIALIFAVTAPKNLEQFGKSDTRYWRVNNYLLFSTCSARHSYTDSWKVHQVGVLGMTFKIRGTGKDLF